MISPRSLSKLFNAQYAILLTSFLAFSVLGCGGSGEKMEGGKIQIEPKDTSKVSNKVVILFHGLGAPGDLDDLQAELKKDLPKFDPNPNYLVLRFPRNNSTQISTSEQADEMYKQLKEHLNNESLDNPAICLIGDSHGGLVALEVYRKYKDELNITGIITNHSPLEGVHSLQADQSLVDVFSGAIFDGQDLRKHLMSGMCKSILDDLTGAGADPLLNHISTTLSTIQIPVLILGGEINAQGGIPELVHFASEGNKLVVEVVRSALNDMNPSTLGTIEALFQGITGGKNDGYLSCDTQSGAHISVGDNVERYVHAGYHHFYGMIQENSIYSKMLDFINNKVFSNQEKQLI